MEKTRLIESEEWRRRRQEGAVRAKEARDAVVAVVVVDVGANDGERGLQANDGSRRERMKSSK